MRRSFMKQFLEQGLKTIYSGMIVLSLFFAGNTGAEMGDSSYKESPLKPVYELIEAQQYEKAIDELNKAEDNDAEVLNLLGFSHRKLKKYDQALNFYLQALELQPKHKAANEYLGELYLETGNLAKAKERLAVLDQACFFGCSEYKTLKRAIKTYEKKQTN